jgi:hypothetical protein
LFTPPAAVFVEVVKGQTLRKFELAADATAYGKEGVNSRSAVHHTTSLLITG